MSFIRKILALFDFPAVPNEYVATGHRVPVGTNNGATTGYQKITTTGAVTTLVIPQGPINPATGARTNIPVGYMMFQNNGGAGSIVRWNDDGSVPSATSGMVLNPGFELDYVGDFEKFQYFIVAGTTPEVDYTFYL